ncbi:Na+/H+ antiporter NhaC family protein [Roseburia intestinalis]|uniref:Na+/H+ antiporter NhaC family protein n=1 Tax=Roseburia intestinalis TaxID=166486 RepID=UPI00189903B5|nr:Na+/H+ antiporter NhaC family protein [Roseburia intestinalis]
MKRKQIGMLIFLAVIVILLFVTANTSGVITDPENYQCGVYATVFALLPPVIAIGLALITKEVYTSLLAGIITGGLLYSNFNLELMINTIFFQEDGGMVYKLADAWNVGILVFLVMLGILVSMLNKAGGSAAFGKWASKHIKTRIGAQISVMILGVLIFVDDYFNCLTVGSVMRPVTDRHKVSRAKLSYIIDATAAPVCIIAPISSWAAAVTSSVPEDSGINGFAVFLQTIPYNLYAILTLVMVLLVTVLRVDFGPMKKHEMNAIAGDLFTTPGRPYEGNEEEVINEKAHVLDLILPVAVLIASCIVAMVYTGGFFEGASFVDAFAASDASVGLVLGGAVTLVFTFIYYMMRDVLSFEEFAKCIPEGFQSMIAPILILTMAWTLSGMTNLLGAKYFVADLVANSASAMQGFLPMIIFLVAAFLAFATGTSWGTFSILIPIVIGVFPEGQMMVISIASCLAGAVCGDHCSPISDTTIMASAGGHCEHVNHVVTQLPYVLVVGSVCMVGYLLIGIFKAVGLDAIVLLTLPICIVLLCVVLFVIRTKNGGKEEI